MIGNQTRDEPNRAIEAGSGTSDTTTVAPTLAIWLVLGSIGLSGWFTAANVPSHRPMLLSQPPVEKFVRSDRKSGSLLVSVMNGLVVLRALLVSAQ